MKGKRHLYSDGQNITGFIFISPWIVCFFGFILIPIIYSLYISFTDYDLLGTPVWTGFDNYIFLVTKDKRFLKSVFITFFYVLVAVPLRLVFSLFIAMILNKKHKAIGFYRALYYLPSIIGTSVAISVVWRMLFGVNGLINKFNALFGLETHISLIANENTAIWIIILLYIWQFGSSMLIFLAGLKNIPDMYYESAVVEGAGFWTKFFKITLPLLSPIIFFNLIMQIIHGFLMFTPAFIVTEGGPYDSTRVYALYMFNRAFQFYDMGGGSAMAWMLLAVISISTFILFRTSKRWVYYEAKDEN
jgi:multiple sugar transport system permease protein